MGNRGKKYHHGDLRRALLDATIELLLAEGSGRAVSLRAAARRAGVSEAAPYRHFTDKRALLAAVAQEGFEHMVREMQAAKASTPGNPMDQLQAMGVAYVHSATEHPAHYKLMFGPELVNREDLPSLLAAAQEAFSYLQDGVEACLRAGLLRPEDPRQVALSAWSVVHGLSSLIVDKQVQLVGLGDGAGLADQVTRGLLAGLAAQGD